ncbi:TAXI family TRAP transporter solute-binding subunit [Paracoccus methylarcula]|uniref:C4-dicarboxylate ABC transporter substrate-binding protein n=1 Tax=Paracoccus methylarcula TaxID=72022 RepID=A0A3R7SC87_9RHOB|nr:TAXI family TRAP transporter solute-binding subunit [Paracoccus methylarcula]RNF33603.1 C4-dicarboxylate ABC transporter substrate-binding protein [Paracoccus methylarcula]
MYRHTKFAAGIAAAISLAGTVAMAEPEPASYILATASTGGTYYPVGVALSTLVKVKLEPDTGISLSAINSAGSGENIRLLNEGEAQFAILQGLFGYLGWNGEGEFAESGPQEKLRSISMLWPNVEQFILDKRAVKNGTVSDLIELKGEAMAFGAENSGALGSTETLLSGLGVDIFKDYKLIYAGYGPSAEALQNGQVKGINPNSGIPNGTVSQVFATAGDNLQMLEVTDEELEKMDGGRELWTRFVIPAGTYPGVEEDIQTIAQPNLLATTADIPEENVYLMTKAIYENLPFLQAIHPATKEMALEQAIAGLPLPLHPGARRYYEEMGVEIPDRLKAAE